MLPVTDAAASGSGFIETVIPTDEEPLPHALLPITSTTPPEAFAAKLTVMVDAVGVDVMVAPSGNVQLYDVANGIPEVENTTPVCPWHTLSGPLMLDVAPGSGFTVTLNGAEEAPTPQLFCPCTCTKPEEAALLKSTKMLFVPEPLAMVAPAGNVQLYVVALAIAPTENGTSVAP